MHSTAIIVPASLVDAANAFGEAWGWGPGNFSVPLSPTGKGPATHYGLHTWANDGFLELLASPPADAAVLVAALTIKSQPGDAVIWQKALTEAGLAVVDAE